MPLAIYDGSDDVLFPDETSRKCGSIRCRFAQVILGMEGKWEMTQQVVQSVQQRCPNVTRSPRHLLKDEAKHKIRFDRQFHSHAHQGMLHSVCADHWQCNRTNKSVLEQVDLTNGILCHLILLVVLCLSQLQQESWLDAVCVYACFPNQHSDGMQDQEMAKSAQRLVAFTKSGIHPQPTTAREKRSLTAVGEKKMPSDPTPKPFRN